MNVSLYDLSRRIILHYEDGSSREATPLSPAGEEVVKKDRIEMFPVGTRVRLVALCQNKGGYDDRPNLPPGTKGVVVGTPDSAGSLPIEWENQTKLAATVNDWIAPLAD